MEDSTKFTVNYASDQSGRLREAREAQVQFDSGVGTSAWWTILTSLLPFVCCSAGSSS
jgi:hypothetical protein